MKRYAKTDLDYKLYLVTDQKLLAGRDFLAGIKDALEGGVTLLQLREKTLSSLEFYQQALKVKDIARQYNVPLIINDRLDIALAVKADGLHVGQEDLPADIARGLIGSDMILGVSVATVEQAVRAEKQGADYLGVGAVFSTDTKGDADKVSLEVLAKIKKAVNIPVVAIGGINEKNIGQVVSAGVDGVAVISAILGSPDIKSSAQRLLKLIK